MAPIPSTQGCRDLVRFGKQRAVVHQGIIKALELSAYPQGAAGGEVKNPFSPGHVVMIVDGSFQNLSGICCINKGAYRV